MSTFKVSRKDFVDAKPTTIYRGSSGCYHVDIKYEITHKQNLHVPFGFNGKIYYIVVPTAYVDAYANEIMKKPAYEKYRGMDGYVRYALWWAMKSATIEDNKLRCMIIVTGYGCVKDLNVMETFEWPLPEFLELVEY